MLDFSLPSGSSHLQSPQALGFPRDSSLPWPPAGQWSRTAEETGELSQEGLTHCRSSRSSPAVWPQRGWGDPRPGIPTFTSSSVSSHPKAQKLLPSSLPAIPPENVSILRGWILATTACQHWGRLPPSPLRLADSVEVATVANRLLMLTDGPRLFHF